MRVWDCFPYWRERWAVEARLRLWAELAPEVDYHAVAFIGDRAHRGTPKPAGLPEPPDGVERVLVVLDADDDWGREEQQRNAVRTLLPRMAADDLILLCDADEIVDPRALPAIVEATESTPVKLKMPLWMCGTRWRNTDPWRHPAACRARDLPNDPSNDLRLNFDYPRVRDAGWHLSYMGSDEDTDAKLSAFAHAEWDTAEKREELAGLRIDGTGAVDDPLTGPLADVLAEVWP